MKKLIFVLLLALSSATFAGYSNSYDSYLQNLRNDIAYFEQKRVDEGLSKSEQEYLNYLKERLEQKQQQLRKDNPNL